IKRSELLQRDESPQSPSSSRSPFPFGAEEDVESDQNVKPDYGFQYDFIDPVSLSHTSEAAAPKSQAFKADDDDDKTQDQEEEEQEYQFRLFTSSAPQKSTPAQAQPFQPTTNPTIRLSATPPPEALAESLSLDKANFIRPNRPDESYYFTSAVPERLRNDLKSQYSQVALSTSDVLSRATSTPWPGTALPWRCIHVVEQVNPRSRRHKLNRDPSNNSPSASVRAATKTDTDTDTNTSSSNADANANANAGRQHDRQRTRPSKKSRILLRRRLALRAERAAQAEKSDELERQKRTQRNREKKVKRKEREKRKKLDDAADPGTHSQSRQEGEEQEDISMLDVDSKHGSISQINEKNTSAPAPPAPAPAPASVSGLGDNRKRDETDPRPGTSGTSTPTPTPKPKPKAPTAPRTTTTTTETLNASSKPKSSTPTTKRPAPTARAV
ncbi:hypothetical protein LTR40_009222, partial [Exophiala xenobiotica]